MNKILPAETILPNDYPMYANYVYIVDNVIAQCKQHTTVGEMKALHGVKEIRRCSIIERMGKGTKIGDKLCK